MVRLRDVLVTCLFASQIAHGYVDLPAEIPPPMVPVPSECRDLMDLFIVIDGSDSISNSNFKILKEAIASLLPQIRLGERQARIGMLVYSSHVPLDSEHAFSADFNFLLNSAMTLSHPRDGTNTALGIEHMRAMFKKYGRPRVPWVCVVITDGISKDGKATAMQANLAKEMGISMLAVGITKRINQAELVAIADTPKQVIKLDVFAELQPKLAAMMKTICPCPTPPAVPRAECVDGPRAIGTVRTYKCAAGYHRRGNPDIVCRDDSTWSPLDPNFECASCGATPVMLHAHCDGVDDLIGARRVYTCDPRYALIGDPNIECQRGATWSKPKFTCSPCGNTPPVNLATCTGNGHFVGDKRKYECDPRYALIGDPFIQCQPDGQWSMPTFSCNLCGNPEPVQHGRCKGGDYFVDTVREYECDRGYALIGDPFIRCLSTGQWSPAQLSCSLCGPTPPIDHGRCGGKDHFVDTVREYTCDTGYALIGDPFIRCQSNGQWSDLHASCRLCGPTPLIDHGRCSGKNHFVDTVREYTCDDGYAMIGDPFIRCQRDGQWSAVQASCGRVCGPTPPIDNGLCGGSGYFVNTVREYTCTTGYALIGDPFIRCEPDGRWSPVQVSCSLCGPTPPIDHGRCGGGDHFVNTERIYECDTGYALIGNPIIRCETNGQWSALQASCSLCGPTPPIDHGRCGVGDHFVNTERIYECDQGYALIGDPIIRCQSNGLWSDLRASCSLCGPTPPLDHGRCGGKDHFVDTVREYTCETGYALIGDPFIRCQNNGQWSDLRASCRLCGPTPLLDHGRCTGKDHFVDTVREYICDDGYAIIGDPFIRCQRDGQWSAVQASCGRVCGPTPPIDNGLCGGSGYFVNTVREYTCTTGYALIGDPFIRCEPDGRWSPVQVSCSLCGPTPPIDHGRCGGGDHFVNTERIYECDTGYALIGNPIIRCEPNGQWSALQASCSLCGPTPPIDHGRCGVGDHFVNTERIYECDQGYALIGDPIIRCQSNGLWSDLRASCSLCGPTPPLEYGRCGGKDHFVDTVREYTCETGYALIGDPFIRCQNNGQWTDLRASCRLCGPTPLLDHGRCTGKDHFVDTIREYICDDGYAVIGDPFIRCQKDGQWSAVQASCGRICGPTPPIDNGLCGGSGYFVNTVREYTCTTGYALIGDPFIRCEPDGRWSPVQVSCSLCGPTPPIDHGRCGGGDHFVNTERIYECDKGYALIGDPIIRCEADGQWSALQASCRLCGPTPPIDHGSCTGIDHFVDTVREYICHEGYALIGDPFIRCLPNGQWSPVQVSCRLCGRTPPLDHGRCGPGGHTVDTVRQYECSNGYAMVGDPYIRCLANGQWSNILGSCHLSCGDPLPIDYGTCDGVDHIVNSVRRYKCDSRYAMIGDPTITCQPNGQWSKVMVSCRPCEEPPVIDNADCGPGGYFVGDRRTYKCKDGYSHFGNLDIKCLPDGMWSHTDLQCKVTECGNPPFVPNAYPKLGSSLIGKHREYYCDIGHRMRGYGRITCLSNGQWENPKFSCEVVTTPKPTTPAPVPSEPSVCDQCRFENGVGYDSHPYDCNQYIQCFSGNNGYLPIYRRCPFGLHWDQKNLTCNYPELAYCKNDRCATGSIYGYKPEEDPNNCCSYWKCNNGVSKGACCGKGMTFNPKTGQCQLDHSCTSPCLYEEELPGCDKRPILDETKFEQHIGKGNWVRMDCAPGTAFNPVDCRCSVHLMTIPGKVRQVCKPVVNMPFHFDTKDYSGQNVYVRNDGVTVRNGAAYFDGNSRLMIPRFTNQRFGGNLVISFRYKEVLNPYTLDQLQALVSNGDCGSDPSIIISKIPEYVILAAKTRTLRTLPIPTVNKIWKEVVFMHDESYLEGKVCGGRAYTSSAGPIQATHCALQIGYGQGLSNFVGHIDNFKVYQCRPRHL